MAFWLSILIAAVFAWFAIKMGLYETWTMLFNIVIAVYLAVFLGPIVATIPGIPDTLYSSIISIFATAVAVFLILHSISYLFITGQLSIPFPKILDVLGSSLLRFLAGFLVWSFVSLLVFMTPVSQNKIVKEFGFGDQFSQTNIPYIAWWCDRVNKIVASEENQRPTEQTINKLIKDTKKKRTRRRIIRKPKPVDPNATTEPNIPPQLKKPADSNGL